MPKSKRIALGGLFTGLFMAYCALPAFSDTLNTSALAPGAPMLPDGFRIAAYLNCGEQEQSPGDSEPRLRVIAGASYAFPDITGPIGTCAFDPNQVEVLLEGLNPAGEYVLGFTWWDADKNGRIESVCFGLGEPVAWTTVLLATPAASFFAGESTWARVLLPLTGEFSGKASLRVAFKKEAGPNAVVSEVWLLEKTSTEQRKRILIVTGDDYPGHRWRETAPEQAAVFREDPRLEVSITEAPAILGSPLLSYYDALSLHFKNYTERLTLGAEIGAGLAKYVNSGRGVVITHFGCGAFEEWPDYIKVAGRVWNPKFRPHDPHGAFAVRMTEAKHPITEGMHDFTTTDELYTCLDGTTPIQTLCDAVSAVDQKAYPMAFIMEGAKGRVFHCVLGHDVAAYSAGGVRELFQRGAAWAAGLEELKKNE